MIIRTSNWIAEVEKLEGIRNCGFFDYKKLLLDRLTRSDQRLTAHKEENLTGDQM